MNNAKRHIKLARKVFFGVALFMCASCGNAEEETMPNNVLVSLGDKTLLIDDVRKTMPGGMTEDDSVRYVKAYVNRWIESNLFSEVASSEIDMENIDKLTEEYRNRLIMLEYKRSRFEKENLAIPEDSVKTYYELNKKELVLERPLIRGTYLKVPEDAKNLSTLRKLYASNDSVDIDKLEKEVLSTAIHYDYFRDNWADWEQVENRIPYDFGKSVDAWLRVNKKLDTSNGGFTYLLYVSDYMPSGASMPYEAARPLIIERMQNLNRREFDAELSRELFAKALQTGKLKLNIKL